MQLPLFSIVTVCLNPGEDLLKTVRSVLSQEYDGFEYIIKDGLSDDETRHFDCSDCRLNFVSQPDEGIYDAMNQALKLCKGRYVLFLNAGDALYLPSALSEVADLLRREEYPDFAYVDRYNEKMDVVTRYPFPLSAWFLFRRPVCHQALFVKRDTLLLLGGFDTDLQLLADYDVLMNLVLEKKARYAHCPIVGVSYKDDGVSSDLGNRRQKMSELRQLRETYYTPLQRMIYGLAWRATLPELRVRLLHQIHFSWLRRILYS